MPTDQTIDVESLDTERTDSLSTNLQAQFEKWLKSRQPQDLKMLENYQDVMRIPRDDDNAGVGTAKAQKSKVFIGSTRSKVRSAKSKIKDSLYGTGKHPFDTTPSNEKLKEYSDVVEELIKYQLDEMNYRHTLGIGVDSLATYGTGWMFGPFAEMKEHKTVAKNAEGILEETVIEYPAPLIEHGRTLDVYYDPDAENEQEGLGTYWAKMSQPHEIKALKGKAGYDDAAIDYALTQLTNDTSEGSDQAEELRATRYRVEDDGRIWMLRYFGMVKQKDLTEWLEPVLDDDTQAKPAEEATEGASNDETMVEAIIVMAGGKVIKASKNPYKESRRPNRRCVYEEVEHEMNGVGIAENNEPNQKVINAAFRLYIEGKAFALLKMCSIDRSKFTPLEDFKFKPGKKFQFREGLTPDERKNAIVWHDMADVTQGWENVIALSEQFSDDDTGITKYSQGTDADHLNKTATGISMILNASSLPLKEVLGNIDGMWIEKHIEDLIEWDLEYMNPEVVSMLLGEEKGQLWAEIKELGKTSFMSWKATGASTFMQKEVLMQKLQGFMGLALGNEFTANLVDARELLEQVWDAAETGKESPVKSDDDEGESSEVQQVKEEAQATIDQLTQALDEVSGEIEQMKKDNSLETVKVGAEAKLKDAQTDKTIAETGKTEVETQAALKELITPQGAEDAT